MPSCTPTKRCSSATYGVLCFSDSNDEDGRQLPLRNCGIGALLLASIHHSLLLGLCWEFACLQPARSQPWALAMFGRSLADTHVMASLHVCRLVPSPLCHSLSCGLTLLPTSSSEAALHPGRGLTSVYMSAYLGFYSMFSSSVYIVSSCFVVVLGLYSERALCCLPKASTQPTEHLTQHQNNYY